MFQNKILKGKDFKEKLDITLNEIRNVQYSKEFIEAVMYDYQQKIKAIFAYKQKKVINTGICLYRAMQATFSGLSDDYGLSKVTHQPVSVTLVEGNHTSIFENVKLIEEINNIVQEFPVVIMNEKKYESEKMR